jgi:hypothetical protein
MLTDASRSLTVIWLRHQGQGEQNSPKISIEEHDSLFFLTDGHKTKQTQLKINNGIVVI